MNGISTVLYLTIVHLCILFVDGGRTVCSCYQASSTGQLERGTGRGLGAAVQGSLLLHEEGNARQQRQCRLTNNEWK